MIAHTNHRFRMRFYSSPVPMTLAQWSRLYDQRIELGLSYSVVRGYGSIPYDAYKQLWHLSDYVVSTVTGGSVYLIPKRENG